MKKVLVTGASGFIGGYIVEELLSQNYRVVGLDNLSKYGEVAEMAEGGGLLSRYRVVKPYRGFESLRLRHFPAEHR